MSKIKVSIAMALYNGEEFLIDQLESINKQTYPIFELVACDDGSTDNTKQIFETYIQANKLENYRYIRNEKNLGYSSNFLHAASLCSGDIILFSDQDDIWNSNKIQKMIDVFEAHPDAEAVVCSYVPFISGGTMTKSLVEYLKKIKYNKKTMQVPFNIQVQTMLSGGLTLAVRKKTLNEIAQYIAQYHMTYDIPVGLICSSRRTLYRIPDVLVKHRIHSSNAGKPNLNILSRLSDLKRHIKGRNIELYHLKCVYNILKDNIPISEHRLIEDEILHREKSILCMRQHKLKYLLWSVFRKNKYTNRIISISNLLCCILCRN